MSSRYVIGKLSQSVILSLSQKPDVFTSRLFFFFINPSFFNRQAHIRLFIFQNLKQA
jgi:hypothetical protein